MFNSSKSRTHRWSQVVLPLLEKTLDKKCVLPKRRITTPEEFYSMCAGVKELMIDGGERPAVRRKSNTIQKKNYSGKKKRSTRKNIVIVTIKKVIGSISPTKHGKLHDKRLRNKTNDLPRIPDPSSRNNCNYQLYHLEY